MPVDPAPALASYLRPRAALGRWGAPGPGVRDGLLAALLAVLGFVPTLSTIGVELADLPERPSDALAVTLLLAQCLPLAVRRRWPGVCLVVVGAAFALHEALSYPPTFASIGLYVAVYSAGAYLARSRRGLAAAAATAYAALAATLPGLGSPHRLPVFLAFALVLVVIWLAGTGMRRRRADEVERRRLAAAVATADERARIAAELHDVVTHHVTAMVIQADAGQYLLPSAPDRASEGFAAISGTGRRALTELRYLLGVLEATGETSPAGRAPALGRVNDLVEQARQTGQPVEWTEHGDRRPRPDAVELAAYRVVQEALTNALKHAAGQPTVVRLRHGHEDLEVEVTTTGPAAAAPATTPAATAPAATPAVTAPVVTAPVSPPGGRGLAGLRERVRVLDGELEAGPLPGGGFGVRALIPSVPTVPTVPTRRSS
ncbi:histidine kinase [Isoptericola sp. NEAU-Y5]|uniref:histidine kinase n=1 Tax=Isoptericola luteus TaxID=2879484 RepID=A0ABS7ZFW9_9MICO|nr:histidine kinase [Isoptericola sp. NEAU-Y5]MCA5892494.1 histidine kinase [Isoptericola sp. NEAU-Y5]